jgi:hypothetical protein
MFRLRGGVSQWGGDAAAPVLEQPLRALSQGLGPAPVLFPHIRERQSALCPRRGGGRPGVLQRRLQLGPCASRGGRGRTRAVHSAGGGGQEVTAASQKKHLRYYMHVTISKAKRRIKTSMFSLFHDIPVLLHSSSRNSEDFYTDPDPRIHILTRYRIRILLIFQMLLTNTIFLYTPCYR